MKLKLIKSLIIAGAFASCNPQEKADENENPSTKVNGQSFVNCYRYAADADTISLKVVKVGESLTGTLVYKLKEKDSNKGTIQGKMQGNILVADYNFLSEGVQSTRQVAFKLEDNNFIEGFGDTFTENGKVYFKSLDSLKFNTSLKLTEVSCQ